MAKKDKSKKKTSSKAGAKKSTVFMLLAVSIALIIFMKFGFFFVLLGFLPSIVAYYADTSRGKNVYFSVLACNASGLAPFVYEIFMKHSDMTVINSIAMDAMTWLVILSSAGVGWLLVWGCPFLMHVLLQMISSSKITHYHAVQRSMVEEWGPEVQRSRH